MITQSFKAYAALTLLLIFTSPVAAESLAPDAALSFGAAAELYVPLPVENAISDGERVRVRSIELTSDAHLIETAPEIGGRLTIGANDNGGDLVFNMREGFVVFGDLLPGLNLRLGKFFLPFGILNQTRRSAWSFISAPLAIERFLSDQGVADTGFDFEYSPATAIHFQAGLTNGYRFDSGISNSGAKPMTPTHFIRPSFDFKIGDSRLTLGANYLMRMNELGTGMRISGLDLTYEGLSWRVGAELYDRAVTPNNVPVTEDLGGYVYGEHKIKNLAVGLRTDYFQIRSLTDLNGGYRENMNLGFTPVLSYDARKNLRVQGSYTYSVDSRAGDSTRNEQRIELRLVTEIGQISKARKLELGLSSL